MSRKTNSRSFAQRPNIIGSLPPLKKTHKNMDESLNRNECPTTRPPIFVIRKRNCSFMQSLTNRKPDSSSAKGKENHKQPHLKINLRDNEKKQLHQKRQVLKQKQINQDMVSVCSIQLQQFTKTGQKIKDEKRDDEDHQKSRNIERLIAETTSTSLQKNGMKKIGKKRKIQECKIRKINWGSKKVVFELGISAIKLNQQQNSNTPLQSLHQLYIQMF